MAGRVWIASEDFEVACFVSLTLVLFLLLCYYKFCLFTTVNFTHSHKLRTYRFLKLLFASTVFMISYATVFPRPDINNTY